ncbi:MAG: tRNA pseudouridine(55) synthase TruB [Deltaproteobacteria bacterium]|nr:MAG: tRNA pseudouridine(55) synthase TruB [Deltaproteobacteria bacterium]
MGRSTDGILLADKAAGESAYDVVRRLKRVVRGVKAGHAGTLDPFATGLMILLLGRATRLSRFLMSGDKLYLGTLRLGVETDTLDPTGRVLRTAPVPDLKEAEIRAQADRFVGDILQAPPAFSAVRHRGTRAYKLARRGEKVSLEKRRVTVHAFRILSVDLPEVTFEVHCSSGTYVRSLAADLGRRLGPGGHLASLRRLRSGPFRVEDALSPADGFWTRKARPSDVARHLISLRDALPWMPEVAVGPSLAKKIKSGYQPGMAEFPEMTGGVGHGGGYFKLVEGTSLAAVAKLIESGGNGHGNIKIERVFL